MNLETICKEYLQNKTPEDYLTLYIHIPYCYQDCSYCMHSRRKFSSQAEVDDYFIELKNNIINLSKFVKDEPIQAMAFGGGTPSILSLKQLKELDFMLKDNLNLKQSLHNMHSIEVGPETFTLGKADFIMHESLFNRVSMGIQTFNLDLLKMYRRENLSIEKMCHLIGYITSGMKAKNYKFNVDLLLGLEKQKIEHILQDILLLRDLDIPMITMYSLKHDRGKYSSSIFYDKIRKFYEIITSTFDENFYFSNTEENLDCLKAINKKYHKTVSSDDDIYHHFFDYHYNTVPDYKNSCIGIGEGSLSWIVPTKNIYTIENKRYNKIEKEDGSYSSIFDHLEVI